MGDLSVTNFYGLPENTNYSVEYCIIEFWSAVKGSSDFKCIVGTTYALEIAEALVKENEKYRTWVKTYRFYKN